MPHRPMFSDRRDAGRRLAEALVQTPGIEPGGSLVVLGLPRGGVPVASEIAERLEVPLDVLVVRKVGAPFQRELAIGAVGEDHSIVVHLGVLDSVGVSLEAFETAASRELAEVERRARLYRGERGPVPLSGQTAIVVDDGLATGATAEVACHIARARGAARLVLAVPVAPPETVIRLRRAEVADELVCLLAPPEFRAVGEWYRDFAPTQDDEVSRILESVSPPPA